MPLEMPPWVTTVLLTFAFYAVVFAIGALVLKRSQRRREPGPETPVNDFFELSPAEVEERFAAIVTQLRAEADQRICDAHERNLNELPGLDGGQQ